MDRDDRETSFVGGNQRLKVMGGGRASRSACGITQSTAPLVVQTVAARDVEDDGLDAFGAEDLGCLEYFGDDRSARGEYDACFALGFPQSIATGNNGLPKRLVSDRKSTRLNSSHVSESRMPSSA